MKSGSYNPKPYLDKNIKLLEMGLETLGPKIKVLLDRTRHSRANGTIKIALPCCLPKFLIKVKHLNFRSFKR